MAGHWYRLEDSTGWSFTTNNLGAAAEAWREMKASRDKAKRPMRVMVRDGGPMGEWCQVWPRQLEIRNE